MDKTKLEHLSWKFIEFCKQNKNKIYSQLDIMNVCNINIVDAIEISNFLTKMRVCSFIKNNIK